MLLCLAPELVQRISDQLAIDDVKALRLTCKDLGGILASHVLRSITIDMKRKNIDKDIFKLQTLARKTCKASRGTRELIIRSLAPRNDPDNDKPWTILGDGQYVMAEDPVDPPEIQLAEEKVKQYLYDALTSLQSVRTVSWMPSDKDNLWVHTTVMDVLKVLPNLQTLDINIGMCKIEVPFYLLIGLRAISICGNSKHRGETLDNLAKMVARSPQLVSIQIHGQYNETQSLHQLFRYYSTDAPPLHLRRLVLKSCLVRFDEVTIPHLKHLTSLNLSDILDTSQSYSYRWGPGLERFTPEQRRYGSSLGDIWNALTKNGVYLEEITADVIVPSLIDYLASYSGLRILSLATAGFHRQFSSDTLASHFYTRALNSHVGSLEKLSVNAYYEGLWCFGIHNLPIISKCLKLKHLCMGIISSQLDSATQPNVIKLLLDNVAADNCQLESLDILASNARYLRDAICGNPAMAHFHYVHMRIIAEAGEYKAPVWCKRLPLLTVASKSFVAEFDEPEGERLRYRQVPSLGSSELDPYSYYYSDDDP